MGINNKDSAFSTQVCEEILGYIYAVAKIYNAYYKSLESILLKYVERMKFKTNQCENLVVRTGDLANHVVYMIEGEDNVHAFR